MCMKGGIGLIVILYGCKPFAIERQQHCDLMTVMRVVHELGLGLLFIMTYTSMYDDLYKHM